MYKRSVESILQEALKISPCVRALRMSIGYLMIFLKKIYKVIKTIYE
ncbi:MAG: hypothetical protein Q9M32_04860 [Sulfurimonas sp.]|nr:hypothetical protein [Sulfurimonas sp.]